MKNIKLLLGLVFIYAHAFSTTFDINKGESIELGKGVEYFIDTSNSLTVEQAANQNYQTTQTKIVNLGNTPNTVWLRFSITSKTESDLFYEVSAPLLEQIQVFTTTGDNSFREIYKGGFLDPFHNRPIALENWLFELNLKKDQVLNVYVKTRSGFPMMLPMTLSAKETFIEKNQIHNIFWGIYMGIMVFAFLYNLFIFISVRERTYFYYILYILGSVTFYLGLQGFTYEFLWPDTPGMNPLLPIIICATNIIISLFALRFLQITRKQKFDFYFGWGIIFGFGLIGLLNIFGPYAAAAGMAQMLSMIMALFYIYAAIRSLFRKVPTAKYFLLAWSIFLTLVFVYLLTINNVIPSNFFTTHSIFIGHMTEVLLLSFALADRINWLKKENEEKQKQIIAQLEENERIQIKANQELEQKVKDRTAEVVEQRNEAVKQKQRSDELLLNILPEATAEELKTTGKAKAVDIESATVMFTDVKNFTKISENLDARGLVDELNKLFSAFDEIIVRNNLEKIKTIGDSYMAAGGLPTPNKTHATDAVNAALEIQEFMKKHLSGKMEDDPKRFEIRLGINSGPVVTGVVGVRKFAYDIWGNTVNIASRMESYGEVGKINISESTYKLVKDHYRCTSRGEVEAKGLGMVKMYFVEGKI